MTYLKVHRSSTSLPRETVRFSIGSIRGFRNTFTSVVWATFKTITILPRFLTSRLSLKHRKVEFGNRLDQMRRTMMALTMSLSAFLRAR